MTSVPRLDTSKITTEEDGLKLPAAPLRGIKQLYLYLLKTSPGPSIIKNRIDRPGDAGEGARRQIRWGGEPGFLLFINEQKLTCIF
jgi:hypothetical protein